MNSFHICHICPSFNNKIYSQLVEKQIKLDNIIRVFYFRAIGTGFPNGNREYVDTVCPYRNMDRISFFYKESRILNEFYKLYKKGQFDIIHAHTLFSAGYIAYKVYKKWKVPYIVAVRGTDINSFFKKRPYLRNLGIRILRNSEKIIFLAPSHKDELLEKFVPNFYKEEIEKKIEIIPNGIDEFWFNNRRVYVRKLEDDHILNIIYYGDINSNKNLESTIEAIKILNNNGYDVKYTVIGRILDNKYNKLLKSESFIKYVDYLPKEELIKYLTVSDLFIMPSKSETFGLSYVESMSQGLPILYTKGQGFDKQFEEGYVGYHILPNDPYDIVNKIKMIIDNYDKISENCLSSIDNFSWSLIADRYQEIYYSCIKL